MIMDVNKTLMDVFCAKFGEECRGQITIDTAMNDIPDWNSYTFIELMMEIEDAFNVTFSDEEVVELFTVAAIQSALQEKGCI